MASDQPAAGSLPTAQLVGTAFVQQFYHILHHSPGLVHRFYLESSKLGRALPDGLMESVTTVEKISQRTGRRKKGSKERKREKRRDSAKAINEKILGMGYNEFRTVIKTVDAQDSLNGGVIVLVTGYLTGKDLVKKDFTRLFFLAPQDKGYFVLNDIFRYIDGDDHQLGNVGLPNGIAMSLSSEQDTTTMQEHEVQEQAAPPTLEEGGENGKEVYNPPAKEEDPATVVEEASAEEVIDEVPSGRLAVVPEAAPVTTVHERKSYASIASVTRRMSKVRYMKENPAPLSVPAPAPARPAPATQERHSTPVPVPAQVLELPPDSSNGTENSNAQEAEDSYSIYVRSLPLSATPAQLEEEFKKFGPIKPGGIQVRSHKIKMPKNSGSSSSSQHPAEGELDRRRRKSSGVSSTNQLATAQAVGSDIILQFYEAMRGCPQRTLQFYEESSKLARPDPHGTLVIVTTLKAIKAKILATDFREFSIDIRTVDEQESLNGGVTVLVTGSLTGKDMVKKDFTQSFFLAPQGMGYFVLNDIFRYVDTKGHQAGNVGLVDGRNKRLKSKKVPTGGSSAGSHQSSIAASMPSANLVGNAFVQQFYSNLCQSPELVYRFYNDRSKLGRPEAHGVMGSVTTLKAIKKKIGAMSFKKPNMVTKTVDVQESFHGGVTVLVTGALTVADESSVKYFIQSFFLAPQEHGYFVLNDIFRYVDCDDISCIPPAPVGTTPSNPSIPEDAQLAMAISASIQSAIAEGVPMEHKTGDAKEGDSRNLGCCVICLDAPVEGACIPCGHMAGCMSCLNAISRKDWGCPVCRAKIDGVLRLYAV